MDYIKVYKQLIKKRRDYPINRTKDNPNVEYHHIIPKSDGGKDSPRNAKYNHKGTNIVGLTIKEHILAHILLSRILNSNNMICAEHLMLSNRNGDKINLRLAAISKERFKKSQSLNMSEYWRTHDYDYRKLADDKKPKKVWMYDFAGNFIKEYTSISSVSRELGINCIYVSDACNLIKRGYHKKYRFVFAGNSAFAYEEKEFNNSTNEYYKLLYDIDDMYNADDNNEIKHQVVKYEMKYNRTLSQKKMISDDILSIVEMMDDTDKKIAHMIIDGLTQDEISDKLCISQQAISKRLNKMQKYFKI